MTPSIHWGDPEKAAPARWEECEALYKSTITDLKTPVDYVPPNCLHDPNVKRATRAVVGQRTGCQIVYRCSLCQDTNTTSIPIPDQEHHVWDTCWDCCIPVWVFDPQHDIIQTGATLGDIEEFLRRGYYLKDIPEAIIKKKFGSVDWMELGPIAPADIQTMSTDKIFPTVRGTMMSRDTLQAHCPSCKVKRIAYHVDSYVCIPLRCSCSFEFNMVGPQWTEGQAPRVQDQDSIPSGTSLATGSTTLATNQVESTEPQPVDVESFYKYAGEYIGLLDQRNEIYKLREEIAQQAVEQAIPEEIHDLDSQYNQAIFNNQALGELSRESLENTKETLDYIEKRMAELTDLMVGTGVPMDKKIWYGDIGFRFKKTNYPNKEREGIHAQIADIKSILHFMETPQAKAHGHFKLKDASTYSEDTGYKHFQVATFGSYGKEGPQALIQNGKRYMEALEKNHTTKNQAGYIIPAGGYSRELDNVSNEYQEVLRRQIKNLERKLEEIPVVQTTYSLYIDRKNDTKVSSPLNGAWQVLTYRLGYVGIIGLVIAFVIAPFILWGAGVALLGGMLLTAGLAGVSTIKADRILEERERKELESR